MIGRTRGLTSGQDGMEIQIPNDEYCKHHSKKVDHNSEKSH